MYVREKRITCGEYKEVDIIPRTEKADKAVKGKRRKQKISKPKQNALNDKNSKRYLVQLGNGNFGEDDYHVTNTYRDDNLPEGEEEAEKIVSNYLRRVAYRRIKLGLSQLMYILVTEYEYGKDAEKPIRIHHHIIMNGGMDREELEMMWTSTRVNWRKYDKMTPTEKRAYRKTIKKLGFINADSLQANENGIEGLCKYITKNKKKCKKSWSSSRNLKRPYVEKNDHKYSYRKVIQICTRMAEEERRQKFERLYPGQVITDIKTEYFEDTGWHIYLKMWKAEKGG